jgi:hypothetical protein
MTSLADFLMRNKLDALGDKPEYTTEDVNSLMPQQPSWSSPLAGLGSYQLSQEAGAEPNWFGRNVLSNIPPEAMHAANFLIPGKVPRIQNPIKAYHGSPHDFDKFDLSKIGTGEGAQAYGHGLYFAENEGVARNYRDALGAQAAAKNGTNAESLAAEWLSWTKGDAKQALAIARSEAARPDYGIPSADLIKAVELLERGDYKPPGRMYEVALHATPEQFLDWDHPIQPPGVRAKLDEYLANQPEHVSPVPEWRAVARKAEPLPKEIAGAAIYNRFAGAPENEIEYIRAGGNILQATKRMQEAGIPGIRYLDQGSRGSGQGTHNYVVWSPELIEILRKYAAPPAIAAPALASILQDQQS